MMPPPPSRRPGSPQTVRVPSLIEGLRTARIDGLYPPPYADARSAPEDLWSAALIHGWADVMEILRFYQDRIRAEGYADTAVEALSRKLLQAEIGIERPATSPAGATTPGRPTLLVLDPGCAASADFILRVRSSPGLPATTWLPAGAQFRYHAADAPSVTMFETDAAVPLRADWNDLPLDRPAAASASALPAGAPGVLVGLAGPQPRAGDHVLVVSSADETAWAFRQVAAAVPNAKAGVCEVIFDVPIAATLAEPRIELLSRRTPLFGWNAADFSALPTTVRRRAVEGHEAELGGGLRLVEAGRTTACNMGLPEGAPRAIAVGRGDTVYLATETGLAWLAPDRVWRTARSGAATRGISCLATAPDGLLLIGTAGGQVAATYDPARGFDRLSGGYVLEAGSGKDPPRPVKAALTGGAIRGLMGFGEPARRILALTDAGLFAYDPRGAWLLATVTPMDGRPDGQPISVLLDGARLTAALVAGDRSAALLACGSSVSAVWLGQPVPPPMLVLDDDAAPSTARLSPDGDGDPDPVPCPARWQWSFPDPVAAIAFLATGTPFGWESFLVAAGDGVFVCDWSGVVRRTRKGLPDGPIDTFVATDEGEAWRVHAVHPSGVYAFDPDDETWSCICARSGGPAGPMLAAPGADVLAVAEPLVLPDEWPGFALDDLSELQLPTPGPELPPGSSMVLTSPGGTTLRATVTQATAAAFDAFGLRERGLSVRLSMREPPDAAPALLSFGRRDTIVYLGGRSLSPVAAPSVSDAGISPGTGLRLAGHWGDLVEAAQPPAALNLPTSGVAGASGLPSQVEGPQIASPWGLQPLDLAGVAAATAKPDRIPASRRVALTGQAACVVPAAPGGILGLRKGLAPTRALPGLDTVALLAEGDVVLAAVGGRGMLVWNGTAWAPAMKGLAVPAPTIRALAAGGEGGDLRFYLAIDDGIYSAASDLAWTRSAPQPPGRVTALVVLASGIVLAGGPGGLFAWREGIWSSAAGGALGAATAVTALLALGERALVAPAAGGVLIGAPDDGWGAWAGGLAGTVVTHLCADGASIWLATSDAILEAEAGQAPIRRLEIRGTTALAAADGHVAAAVPGEGVYLSTLGNPSWTRLAVGLNNDLSALAFDAAGTLLAGAGARLRLRDTSGVWTALAGPAPIDTVPASTAITGALDAGLCSPLRTALPDATAKLLADDAVITLVEPGRRWIVGSPGQRLGDGALMLDADADGVAVRAPLGPFSVVDAAGAAPWGLSLASDAGSGFAEAWPHDLVFVSPKPAAPVETIVRSVVSATPAADVASTLLTLDSPVGKLFDPAGTRLTANVVTATQGETVAGEVLGDGDSSRSFQTFKLRRSPLTFTPTADGGSRSSLRVFVDGIEWTAVGSLVGTGPSERVYVAWIGTDDRTTIRFGDGFTGARLPSGRGNVRATYRAGMRVVGDLAGGVTTLLTARPSVGAVRGLLRTPARPPAKGRSDARLSPGLLRGTGRLVTAGDYADLAASLPAVAAARADELRVHGRSTLYLSLAWSRAMKGATAVEAALAEVRQVLASAQAIPPPPFRVGACARRAVRIAARLWLSEDGDAGAVRTGAESTLARLFGDGTPAIGASMRRAEIEDALQALAGVSGVAIDALHFADHPVRSNEVLRALPARLLPSGTVAPAQGLALDGGAEGVALTVEASGDPA